ncbi:MAG: molybdopterin cofactor-binding domain-containing protein, partial [Deferribacterota bacterium]|nr:molybdopterin cofactor-binding domain-containing protein [Deferribacterota bacterium]
MKTLMNRRDALKVLSTAGLSLAVITSPFGVKIIKANNKIDDEFFTPTIWLHISTDGTVVVIVNKSEMGQGVYTSLPQILGDELGANWDSIYVCPAPAREKYIDYKSGAQLTGGSTSIRHMYMTYRIAGATAREMLIETASERWKVDRESCFTRDGFVIGPNNLKIPFGRLVKEASKKIPPLNPKLKDESKFYFIGKPMRKFDIADKVNGMTIFGIDKQLEGMCYATVKRSVGYGGSPANFNIDKLKNDKDFIDAFKIGSGVAVVAKKVDKAISLRDKVDVSFTNVANPKLDTQFIETTLKSSINKRGIVARSFGKVDDILETSKRKLTSTYLLPYLAHVTLEPMNCTVDLKEDRCDLWVPTQSQSGTLSVAKQLTGFPEEKIHVHTTYLGAGLGRKAEVDFVSEAVEIAKKVKKPVKLIWTREDDFKHDFYRPANISEITASLNDNNKISAWKHKIAIPSIWERVNPKRMYRGVDPSAVEGLVNLPYDVDSLHVEFIKVDFPIPVGFWRSVGSTHNGFTVESFIDELAYMANIDPVEFRLKHLKNDKRAARLVDLVAEKINWGNKESGYGYGVAQHFSFGSYAAEAAKVEVDEESGKILVRKVVAAIDCGKVVNPKIIKEQVTGAVIMGISTALKEKMEFANGGAKTNNFYDYKILSAEEAPDIEVYVV